ncbi:MAG TPA: hypothetical protein VLS49_15175 [Usitatibacter sp.]|nr:hypothetical protein [Usitatibacter sp.]
MSLLLDALKRAEQEKLTRQADRPAAPEPAVRAAAAASVLELQPIGGTQAAQAAQRADAQAAQNVFKAKAAAQAPRHRRILL